MFTEGLTIDNVLFVLRLLVFTTLIVIIYFILLLSCTANPNTIYKKKFRA